MRPAADSGRTFLLSAKELSALPTWDAGVRGPFGEPIHYSFRRHLERVRRLLLQMQMRMLSRAPDTRACAAQAAAQKHGAAGVEGARSRQADAKAKRQQRKADTQARH